MKATTEVWEWEFKEHTLNMLLQMLQMLHVPPVTSVRVRLLLSLIYYRLIYKHFVH